MSADTRTDLDDVAWWLQSNDPALRYLRSLDAGQLAAMAVKVTVSEDGSPESRQRLLDRIRAVAGEI